MDNEKHQTNSNPPLNQGIDTTLASYAKPETKNPQVKSEWSIDSSDERMH